jgi:hypothetical protein
MTFPVNLAGNHVFVKVLTDEHLYGIGEVYRVGPDEAVDQVIHYFKDFAKHRDSSDLQLCQNPSATANLARLGVPRNLGGSWGLCPARNTKLEGIPPQFFLSLDFSASWLYCASEVVH